MKSCTEDGAIGEKHLTAVFILRKEVGAGKKVVMTARS
jgi:hypothetical protein